MNVIKNGNYVIQDQEIEYGTYQGKRIWISVSVAEYGRLTCYTNIWVILDNEGNEVRFKEPREAMNYINLFCKE